MDISLRKNLFYCVANTRPVFLDLAADRYFCLPPAADRAFRVLLTSQASEEAITSARQALQPLNILATPTQGSCATKPVLPVPRLSSMEQPLGRPHPGLTLHAIAVQLVSAVRFKTLRLETIVRALARRRRRSTLSVAQPTADKIDRLVCAFHATRALISRQDQCLRCSIALLNFLSVYNVFPRLVIGVRANPFAAHAWVQIDDLVLNDGPDAIRGYTPILVV